MSQNEETYILSLVGQDQGAIQLLNNAQDALQGITDQAEQLTIPFDTLNASISQLGDGTSPLQALTDQTDQLDFSVRTLTDHYNEAAIAMQNAAASVPDLNNVSGDAGDDAGDDAGGFSVNPRALSTAGRLVGGGTGRALRAAGQVSRLSDMLPDDTAALVELGSAGLVAAPALAGAALALKSFNDGIQADKDLLNSAITGQQAYYQAIAQDDTTDQVTQKLQQLSRQRDTEAQQLASIQGEEASAFQQTQQNFGDLGARLLDTQSPVATLRGEAEKLQTQVESDTTSINALTQGLQNNAFAANDAANEQQLIASQRLKDANEAEGMTTAQRQDRIRAINDELDNIGRIRQGQPADVFNSFNPQIDALQQEKTDLQSYAGTLADVTARQNEADRLNIGYAQDEIQANQMTAAQRKQRIDDINNELAVDEKLINNGTLSATATKQVSDQMSALSGEANILGRVLDSAADNATGLAQAAKKLTDEDSQYLDALTAEGKARDAITQDTQQMSQLRSDEQAKETTAATELQTKLTDIQAKGAQEQQKLATDNQDAIARILRDAASSEQDDIGNRDALKYQQDQQKAQQQIADQSASYKKQEDQLTTNLHDQENAAKQSEQNQLTQLQSALSQQEQVQNQKLQQDEVNLQNVLNTELAISNNSAGQIITAHETMWEQIGQVTGNWTARIVQQINQALGTNLTVGGLFNSGTPLPPITGTQTGIPDYATVNASLAAMAGALNGASGNRLVP